MPTPPPPYPEQEEENDDDDKKQNFRPNTIDAEVVVEVQPRVYGNVVEEPEHEIPSSEPPSYSEEPPLKPVEVSATIEVTLVEEENNQRSAEELEDSLEIPCINTPIDEEVENKENKLDINENQEKDDDDEEEPAAVVEKKSSIVLPPTEVRS